MFREKWSVLDGKPLLQASELKHAQLLAHRLISAVGDREQTPTQLDAATMSLGFRAALIVSLATRAELRCRLPRCRALFSSL